MNFLSLFVLLPLLTLAGLWLSKNLKQVHAVAVTGASALLILTVYLTVDFLLQRAAGNTAEMLYTASVMWFEPLNIHYAVGVDGISVSMLLLTSIILFTGVFASWTIVDQAKEYYMWFLLLTLGVYGFFISIDLFTMFTIESSRPEYRSG